ARGFVFLAEAPMSAQDRFATHLVENQPPLLEPYDAWATDVALREAGAREGGGFALADIAAYGELAGGELAALAMEPNRDRPQLRSHDRQGHRIDRLEFHPAYHPVMRMAMDHGVHAYAWLNRREGAHVV